MKRTVCLLFCVFCLAALILLPSFSARADASGNWVYTVLSDGSALVEAYTGKQAEVSLNWNLDGHVVSEIGERAFAENPYIQSVKLPVGITVIRAYAFEGCENLEEVILPSRLETIEDGVFIGCASLMEVELPDSVMELGENCFAPWTALTGSEDSIALAYAGAVGLEFSEKIETTPTPRPDSADYQWEIRDGGARITSYIGTDATVIIPETLDGYPVTTIGDSAFSSRYEVQRVILPEGLTTLEGRAFRYCPYLFSIQFPTTLTFIGEFAFFKCENLSEVVLYEGLTTMENRAFQGCSQLRKVTLPASLETIPYYAFYECNRDFTICAPKGSRAQRYAADKGYKFTVLESD